jgi:hypothetical protein
MLCRRVTCACAVADWSCQTHDEVVDIHASHPTLARFLDLDRPLDHCHRGRNLMDRSRDCDGPGPHSIGNLHIKAPAARRAWLWRGTGELDPLGDELTLDWMIAERARRRGDPRTDLQATHIHLLCDPDDTWLPTVTDYLDLAAWLDAGWLDRARDAVRNAGSPPRTTAARSSTSRSSDSMPMSSKAKAFPSK